MTASQKLKDKLTTFNLPEKNEAPRVVKFDKESFIADAKDLKKTFSDEDLQLSKSLK